MSRVHPIEALSYELLAERVDLSGWAPGSRAVVERVVHATADVDYADSMIVDEDAVSAGRAALAKGAPVVADVAMTAAGIAVTEACCHLGDAVAGPGETRSAAGIRAAAAAHVRGAVFVVGCAPTALTALVDLAVSGRIEPALVVGTPVGFVGSAEAKELLRGSGLPAVSNRGEKGGAAAAAAALNAIGRL